MKRLTLVLAFLLTAVIGQVIAPPPKLHAATTELLVAQSCSGSTVNVDFGWRGNDPQALQQWLDLSLFDNGWRDGTFLSAGPFPGSATSFRWTGITAGTQHFVRVNQQLGNGGWDPSPTFQFVTAACVPASPGPQAPTQPAVTSTTLTIEGRWLLYDGVGVNFITFDANGKVLAYEPQERASGVTGNGSLANNTLTFSYTAFDPVRGTTVSVSFHGTRVRDEDLAKLGLPENISGSIVFFGDLELSDLPGLPISVVAIKR